MLPHRPTDREIVEVVSELMDVTYEPATEEEASSIEPRLERASALIERLEGRGEKA